MNRTDNCCWMLNISFFYMKTVVRIHLKICCCTAEQFQHKHHIDKTWNITRKCKTNYLRKKFYINNSTSDWTTRQHTRSYNVHWKQRCPTHGLWARSRRHTRHLLSSPRSLADSVKMQRTAAIVIQLSGLPVVTHPRRWREHLRQRFLPLQSLQRGVNFAQNIGKKATQTNAQNFSQFSLCSYMFSLMSVVAGKVPPGLPALRYLCIYF